MLRPFIMGLRRDRHTSMEDRTSRRRFRHATPRVETLEKILPLSDMGGAGSASTTVSAIQLQTEAANPTVDLSVSANAPGDNSDTANYITINEVVVLGDQSQTLYVEASQQDPNQYGQSPGTVTVSAAQTQAEIANPTVALHVSANASGANSVAFNYITVNMDIMLGDQSQTLYAGAGPQDPSQIGQSPDSTIIFVSAAQTQTQTANPTVALYVSANASGANSVAFNYITVNMNTQFGTQTQYLVIETGPQDPSQIGQSPDSTIIVSATQTQTGTVKPRVNLSAPADASGTNADAANFVTVITDTMFGDQKQTLLTADA